jgi:hypothetical protein
VGVRQQCRPDKPMGGKKLPTLRLTSGPTLLNFQMNSNKFKIDLMKKWASQAPKISNKLPRNSILNEEKL